MIKFINLAFNASYYISFTSYTHPFSYSPFCCKFLAVVVTWLSNNVCLMSLVKLWPSYQQHTQTLASIILLDHNCICRQGNHWRLNKHFLIKQGYSKKRTSHVISPSSTDKNGGTENKGWQGIQWNQGIFLCHVALLWT